jgi:ABC-type glycerol-3-phosphate transport system permease component
MTRRMVASVLQRRPSRWTGLVDLLVLAGLIIPPAVVPTVSVLQRLGLFRTMPPLIMFAFFHRQIVAGMTSGAGKGWTTVSTRVAPAFYDP